MRGPGSQAPGAPAGGAEAERGLVGLLGRITAQQTVEDLCRAFVEGVRDLMGFERAGLFLWDPAQRIFYGTFGTDLNGRTTDERHVVVDVRAGSPEARILNGSVIERGCRLSATALRRGEESVEADLLGLRVRGELYGVLSVDNQISRRPVSDAQLRTLSLASQVLGNAIESNRSRARLAESEERFRELSESSGEWLWDLGRDGLYSHVGAGVERILGYTPDEMRGSRLVDFVAEEDRARVKLELHKVQSERRPAHRLIHRQKRKQGGEVVIESAFVPRVDRDGNVTGCRGVHRDVTREQELEAQLRQSQKMETVGRLVGGIAHDFNNLLTTILGCTGLVLEELPGDGAAKSDLEQIQAAGEKAAALTRQLLAFSRKQILHIERLSLNDVVVGMEKLLMRTLGENIDLAIDLDPAADLVQADASQLEQVILNLAVNARDAMVDPAFMARARGRAEDVERERRRMAARAKQLSISTRRVTLTDTLPGEYDAPKPGPYVMLAVRDTGIGMPPEVQAHLFEPFFTTREVGRGSGLGLSMVYGIIRQLGGGVRAESVFGEGSTFRVYLPSAGAAAAKPAPGREPGVARGTETVLVVEDEDSVRRLTVRMLESLGYRTLQAGNGAEALKTAGAFPGRIHLVISDIVMPRMSGRRLVQELRKVRNDFHVLFVSGYSEDESVNDERPAAEAPVLQKPFTRGVLARKTREILDGGNA